MQEHHKEIQQIKNQVLKLKENFEKFSKTQFFAKVKLENIDQEYDLEQEEFWIKDLNYFTLKIQALSIKQVSQLFSLKKVPQSTSPQDLEYLFENAEEIFELTRKIEELKNNKVKNFHFLEQKNLEKKILDYETYQDHLKNFKEELQQIQKKIDSLSQIVNALDYSLLTNEVK